VRVELIETAIALNPHYSWDYLYNLGRAHYALGNYQQAADYLRSGLRRNESPFHPRLFLVATYVRLGRQDDAEWEVEELMLQYPETSLSHVQNTTPITDNSLFEKLLQDLRAAGVPE
jgi:tetratricopeptide (TPR) repeat protein